MGNVVYISPSSMACGVAYFCKVLGLVGDAARRRFIGARERERESLIEPTPR